MKYVRFIIVISIITLCSSCSSMYHYVQVFNAESVDKSAPIREYNGGLLYEDDNCSIYYSFWSEGGDASFEFYNKTNNVIYLDLRKTFFIQNGIANDYYKNRVWIDTKSQTTSSNETKKRSSSANISSSDLVSTSTTSSINKQFASSTYTNSHTISSATTKVSTIEITEQPIIAIPPKSKKTISEYSSIYSQIYLACDLYRYPSNEEGLYFSVETSPIVFENYITYNFGKDSNEIVVQNKFYISSITNYAEPTIIEYVERESRPCQNITDDDSRTYSNRYQQKVYDLAFKINTNNCFYMKYKKLSRRKLYEKGVYYQYNDYYNGYIKPGEK